MVELKKSFAKTDHDPCRHLCKQKGVLLDSKQSQKGSSSRRSLTRVKRYTEVRRKIGGSVRSGEGVVDERLQGRLLVNRRRYSMRWISCQFSGGCLLVGQVLRFF